MKPGNDDPVSRPGHCPHCGKPIGSGRNRGGRDRGLLLFGIASLLVLLILGILDSVLSGGGGTRPGAVRPMEPLLETNNLIANGSLEQADGSVPTGWRGSGWGANSARFDYLETGKTGSRSVKVTMLDYTDGDAKWVHEPVQVSPGADYQFSDSYQSNVPTQVVVELHHEGGKTSYLSLPEAPVSEEWNQYSASFSVPMDVGEIIVFHFLASPGYLVTDDYAIRPHEREGFEEPMVTLTFDDGWEQNVVSALPLLEGHGFRTVQFFATKFVEGIDDSGVRLMMERGHEIGAHSVNHPDLTTVSDEELDYEVAHSRSYLESVTGRPVVHFATPFGAYDRRVVEAIRRHGFVTHRSVDEGFNSRDSTDPYRLFVQNIRQDTTAEEVRGWIDKAKRDRYWLILVYHRIGGGNLGPYDSSVEDFAAHLEVIEDSEIPVVTMSEALEKIGELPGEVTTRNASAAAP